MRLLFITHGSTGDTVPMIRIAAEASDRGHAVTFVAATFWQKTCENRGLRFIGIPPRGGIEEHSQLMKEFSKIRDNRRLLVSMFGKADPWFSEVKDVLERELPDTDALIVSYLFSLYHRLSDKIGLPSVAVHFCPNTAISHERCVDSLPQPPSFLPSKIRKFWASGLNQAADRYVCGLLRKTISNRDLHPRSFLIPPTTYSLVLATPKPFGIDHGTVFSRVSFTGFLKGGFGLEKEESENSAPENPKGGVLISFGSVTTEHMDAQFRALYAQWPEGKPLTIQSGWFAPPEPPGNKRIQIIGPGPHNEIFPKASLIIHHGGAGTTTSAFFSARPQIVVPHFADQFFWARTVRQTGCGLAVKSKEWGKRILPAVQKIEADQIFQNAAREFATEFTDPGSAERAVKTIESWIEQEKDLPTV